MGKAGRPAINWTTALEDDIAKRLLNRSLLRICSEDKDIPSRAAINEHLAESEVFWTKCARARRIHALQRLENVELDVDSCNPENAKAVSVKVSYAQWFAEKVLPKEFGQRFQADMNLEVSVKRVITDV